MKALTKTDLCLPGQKSVYHGKVRDVYDIGDDLLKYLRVKVSEAIKEDKAYDISFTRNGALAYNYVVDVAIHLNDFIK